MLQWILYGGPAGNQPEVIPNLAIYNYYYILVYFILFATSRNPLSQHEPHLTIDQMIQDD